ncbi:5-histidylcysteine sulfoxide synthase [Sulfurospirillum sp. 1612]|uniref:5-histidylcysteine sulfoxide synthase n=1 Tax=Sulfurospirillum sp. 1612 TaxID=3094835 RepID=UPI002F944ED2
MQKNLITKNIALKFDDTSAKRAEIREYFLKTYTLFEKQFEIFTDDSVFYEKPEPLRHQLIFYFGHTATFFMNKLLLGKQIQKRINPTFESIFSIGVDEMSWDDLDKVEYNWPSVDDVRVYREAVKKVVLDYIDSVNFSSPIGWDSPMWVILMGIEHERIHIETSSVLHRQLDSAKVKEHPDFPICEDISTQYPQNELLSVKGKTVKLGKERELFDFYGWDNEYGTYKEEVEDFKASKYLVSNGEYLEFVRDGGYENDSYWSDEGKQWKAYKNAKFPTFWIKDGEDFQYKSITKVLPLPLNWPVDVNFLEAEAFCNYKSQKLNKNITLPNEAMYRCLVDACKIANEPQVDANLNFEHFTSSTPVDRFKQGKFYDVIGNVWQWTTTPIDGFEGFQVHPLYDDFSVPTFDTRHNIMKGGSWASTGNEVLTNSRYAFRRHFFQHAGFRYVQSNYTNTFDKLYYEKDEIISQYCEFHYGDEHFGVKNFAKKIAEIAEKYAINKGSVLDIGCSVGRTSFELCKTFERVTGIDFSARFINVAQSLKENGFLRYEKKIEGDIKEQKEITLKDLGLDRVDFNKLEFWQGDACNLKPHFEHYDMIVAINLLDRLYNPKLFLQDVSKRLNDEGIFIVASPFTWSEEYVKKENWLGGKVENGKAIYSQDRLSEILQEHFEPLSEPFDVAFVIQEHVRKFQHTLSKFSVWKKKKGA